MNHSLYLEREACLSESSISTIHHKQSTFHSEHFETEMGNDGAGSIETLLSLLYLERGAGLIENYRYISAIQHKTSTVHLPYFRAKTLNLLPVGGLSLYFLSFVFRKGWLAQNFGNYSYTVQSKMIANSIPLIPDWNFEMREGYFTTAFSNSFCLYLGERMTTKLEFINYYSYE